MLAVFALSQIFFIALILSAYHDYRVNSAGDLLQLHINGTAQKINSVTSMGRHVQNYTGAVSDLYDLKMISRAADAFVVDASGNLVAGNTLYNIDIVNISELNRRGGALTIGELTYQSAPFFDIRGDNAGYVLAAIGDDSNSSLSDAQRHELFFKLAIALVLSIFIFASFFVYSQLELQKRRLKEQDDVSDNSSFSRFKSFLLPFFLSQLLVLGFLAPNVTEQIADYNRSLEFAVVNTINKDFVHIARLGINLNETSGIDSYFESIKEQVAFIDKISLRTPDNSYLLGDDLKTGNSLPIIGREGIIGLVVLSTKIDYTVFTNLGLQLLTLFFISIILTYELSTLLKLELNRHAGATDKIPFEPALIRPICFLLVLATYLPVSIVPVVMGRYAEQLSFLTPEMVKSLAVSTEMSGIAISSFMILFLDQLFSNWKKVLTSSLMLMTLGMALSFISFNAVSFLAGRFCYGLAYGGIILGCQLCVMSNTDDRNRSEGMAGCMSGLFSGVLCSIAAGGMIADTINPETTFLIASIGSLINLVILLYLMKNRVSSNVAEQHFSFADTRRVFTTVASFLKDLQSISLFLFQVLPYAMIGIGFFNFFLPVIIQENGLGASAVGQLNFLYAFLIILLGPKIGRILDKTKHKHLILTAALVFSALVPIAFEIPNIIAASIVAMILLGISGAVNEGGQPAFIAGLKVAKNQSQTVAVKLLDCSLRIGQILGPLIVAAIMTSGASANFSYLALAVACCALAFFISQTYARHKEPLDA